MGRSFWNVRAQSGNTKAALRSVVAKAGMTRELAVRRSAATAFGRQSQVLKIAIEDLGLHVKASAPRRIPLLTELAPIVLLTDAAYECEKATFGAVIFDPVSMAMQFFGGTFAAQTVSDWRTDIRLRSGKAEEKDEQVICQAELAVIPLAIATWSSLVKSREILVFIDNNPACDALVHGISGSHASSEMVKTTRLMCARLACAPWFDRVPSPSNLADDPSRGIEKLLLAMGAQKVTPECSSSLPFCIE